MIKGAVIATVSALAVAGAGVGVYYIASSGGDGGGSGGGSSYAAAASVIPEPGELPSAGWKWSWEDMPGQTKEEYLNQWHKDPRVTMGEMVAGFEAMSDEEFKQAMQFFGGMAKFLGTGGEPEGENVSGIGLAGDQILESQVTREQFIATMRARVDGILDYAVGDYSREDKPMPDFEANPDAKMPSLDGLTLKVMVYSDDLIASQKAEIDVTDPAKNKLVAEMMQVQENAKKNREKQAQELAEEYSREEEAGRADGPRAKELLKSMQKIAATKVDIGSALITDVQSGFIYWEIFTDGEQNRATVIGRMRVGNGYLEFSRYCDGSYAPSAVDDTKAVIEDMKKRMAVFQ